MITDITCTFWKLYQPRWRLATDWSLSGFEKALACNTTLAGLPEKIKGQRVLVVNADLCYSRSLELFVGVIINFTSLGSEEYLKFHINLRCDEGKLYLWRNLLQWFDFGVGEKIANARTCADSNGHNFWKIENVQGFLHIFAYKGLNLTAV